MNKQKQLLEQPFSPDQIKTRPGSFGKVLSYVEMHHVVKRLNQVFETRWSFKILRHEVLDNEVLVLGRLTVEDEVVKEQFGCSSITKNKDTQEYVSLANDLKAASSDSLKRCAMLLGIALHLHESKRQDDSSNKYSSKDTSTNRQDNQSQSTNHTSKISPKQYDYLLQIAASRGLDKEMANAEVISRFGVAIDDLTKQTASKVIQQMLH